MNPPTSLQVGAVPKARVLSLTFAYYVALMALGLTTASMGPTLPGLAAQTGVRLAGAGFLFTARSLGYMLGSLAGGRLYDRVRGHVVLASALALTALTMAAVPAVPRLWLLTGVLLVLGLAEGTVDVGSNTLLVWVHHDRVGPFMNGLHFFFGIGAFLSPIIVAQVILHSGGIAWAYCLLALAVLLGAAWLLRLPSPTNRGEAELGEVRPANYGLVALVAAFLFFYVGAELGFGGWVYTYALAMGLLGPASAAYLTSAFWGSFTVGRLLGIPIAARFGPQAILVADLAGGVASLTLVLACPHSMVALWLGTLGVGLAMASIFPTTISLAERRMAITGRATGWLLAGGGAGSMLLPWLMGQAFEPLGPQAAMLAVLAALCAAGLVLAVLSAWRGPRAAERHAAQGG